MIKKFTQQTSHVEKESQVTSCTYSQQNPPISRIVLTQKKKKKVIEIDKDALRKKKKNLFRRKRFYENISKNIKRVNLKTYAFMSEIKTNEIFFNN